MGKSLNSIYLGNIDPNNDSRLDPLNIRRYIMRQLLIWDSIVLSDSQYLTDPRIHRLMENYLGPISRLPRRYSIERVAKWQKGFEKLLQTGLVEVAHRGDVGEIYTMQKLWTKMEKSNTVPFLPRTIDYASYLDTLKVVHRDYNLAQISDRFKRNLLAGVECGDFICSPTDETDQHLLLMFQQEPVYFRYIHDFIKQQRDLHRITQERYEEIYNYVFSCYSVNISAETNCYISSKVKNIPLHLNSGTGNFDESLAYADQGELRYTWALLPEALDLISIDEFIDIRKEVQKIMGNDKLVKYYTGILKREEWKDFSGNWEVYTRKLEKCLKECLRIDKEMIGTQLVDKGTITQQKSLYNGATLVASVLSCAPVLPGSLRAVSAVAGYTGIAFAIYALTVDELRKRKEEPLRERRSRIQKLLASNADDAEIITKY